ncbi:DUF4139 domain-containing protein [Streptomyces sp. NPDC020807]|uniref:DUF4139 domain-containing protein n=1 Tax=Streptomyces sp. NPDC020807 TaxID=3155119 RepID=UPI0033D7682E
MTAEVVRRWGSSLDSVVVYAQGALCRRIARGTVPGDRRVRVTGLPRSLDPGSLRARVLGLPGLRVTEARVEVEAEPVRAGLAGDGDLLRREVDRLSDEQAAARARVERQTRLIKEVTALHPVPPARKREDPHRRTPVDAWLDLADFVDERLAGLHARLVELEKAVTVVDHELDLAFDRLARASTDAPSAHVDTTVSAVLTLAADHGGPVDRDAEVTVEVEYGVPGAVWVPSYRLDHRQGDETGRLVLRASVAQRTGEDWTGVRVALSSADLQRRTDLPRLRSLRIGRRQEAPAPSGWREPPAGLAELFAGYDSAGPRPAFRGSPMAGSAPGSAPVAVAAPPPPPPAPAPAVAPSGPPAFTGVPDFAASAPYGGGAPQSPVAPPPAPMARLAPSAPAPPGGLPAPPPPAPPPPAPVAGPPEPSLAELDYGALVLSGPDDRAGRRGRLFPDVTLDPVATEYRRRAEAVASLPLPGRTVRPRASAGSFDHRFDAAARADIPSDGTWHSVTVGEIAVGLRTEYVCVPSVEQTVYASLLLSNATEQALLAGPVEVSVDDDFLLTASLPTLAPGAVRRVGLGPAEGIRVSRRTQLRESVAGLRNNITVLDHRVHVELANRLAKPVTVEVLERVPVTSDADVRIEERADWTEPDSGAAAGRQAPGTRVWRVRLDAGATSALDGGYEIRIPTGKALVGGNRRS